MSVTLKDIARATGLSTATVSKHLNGIRIDAHNAQIIDKAVSELGYRKNESARNLKTRHTNTIGLLTHNVRFSYSSSIMLHVQNFLRRQGYTSLLGYSEENVETESELLDTFLGRQVDGVIAIPTDPDNIKYRDLKEAGVPLVILGNYSRTVSYNRVVSDSRAAIDHLAASLAQYGHRTAAIIRGSYAEVAHEIRVSHLISAFARYGIEVPPHMNLCCDHYSMSEAYDSTVALLKLETPPTVIICINFELLYGTQTAILSHCLRIPKDVSIVVFSHYDSSHSYTSHKLTAITMPAEEIAKVAVSRMMELIAGTAPSRITTAIEIPSGFYPGFSIGPANQTNIKEHIRYDDLLF